MLFLCGGWRVLGHYRDTDRNHFLHIYSNNIKVSIFFRNPFNFIILTVSSAILNLIYSQLSIPQSRNSSKTTDIAK